MKESLRVKIHSIVDVITNSSTQIYVSATDNTIKAIKGLVDDLLFIGGSDKKADDLFEFELEDVCIKEAKEYYITHILHKEEFDKIENYRESQSKVSEYYNKYKIEKPEWWDLTTLDESIKEDIRDNGYCVSSNDYEDRGQYAEINLIVTPKNCNDKKSAEIANVLGKLTELFNIDGSYNG